MSLLQKIILVNRYTIKNPTTGKGSRGSTPGRFITSYMARDPATETLAPVRKGQMDSFILRYMARASAVESLSVGLDGQDMDFRRSRRRRDVSEMTEAELRWRGKAAGLEDLSRTPEVVDNANVDIDDRQPTPTMMGSGSDDESADEQDLYVTKEDVKDEFKAAQMLGGVGFGYGSVSLSHDELIAASDEVQQLFDEGKTVMRTVLSFRHDFLVEHDIVRKDLKVRRAGDYSGEIDEMKLRLGVMSGVERMARTCYDDLRYVGVIQVDTKNVHAHVVMVDAGEGTVMSDGTQRGRITPRARGFLRRGIDNYLDEQKHMARLSASVGAERRNVAMFVKRWAMQTIVRESKAQFVMASLPEDQRLWRANSHAESMTKANSLVRSLVEERLAQPDSPMSDAMGDVQNYARRRQGREGLSDSDAQQLVDAGRERITQQAMNGVYSVLSAIPKEKRDAVSTSVLQVMNMDQADLLEMVHSKRVPNADAEIKNTSAAGLEEFGLRARTYASRRRHHRELRNEYEAAVRDWEKQRAEGVATPESRAMYDHYQTEAGYHGRAAQKYEQILGAVVGEGDWQSRWEEVAEYGDRHLNLQMMRKDKSLARMADEDLAETYGRKLYGQAGGGSLSRTGLAGRAARAKIDSRIDAMAHTYAEMIDKLNADFADQGAHLRVADKPAVDKGVDANASTALATRGPTELSVYRLRRSQGLKAMSGPGSSPQVIEHDENEPVGYFSNSRLHRPGEQVELVQAPRYSRKETVGVDMHDIAEEITDNIPVGKKIRRRFVEMTDARRRALNKAKDYLAETMQSVEPIRDAEQDISRAERTADMVRRTGQLVSQIIQKAQRLRRRQEREQVAQEPAASVVNDGVVPADEKAEPQLELEPAPKRAEISAREKDSDQQSGQLARITNAKAAVEVYDTTRKGTSFTLDERVRQRVNRRVDLEINEARKYFEQDELNSREPIKRDSGLGN